MKKQIETTIAHLSYDKSILLINMKPDVEFDEVAYHELFEISNQLTNFEKRHVIIDATCLFNVTSRVRELYAMDENIKYRFSDSFIVTSLPMRLVINFYISINKPKIPTKIFDNEKKAIEWVNSLKKEMGSNL